MWAQDQRYASDQLYRHNMAQPTTSTMLTKNVDGNIRLLQGSNSSLQNMAYSSSMELNVVKAINIVNSQSHHSILPTFTQEYELIYRENEKKMIIDAVNKLNNGENNLIELITKLIEFKTDYLNKFQQGIVINGGGNSLNDYQKILSEEQTGIKWLRCNFHLKAKEFLKSDYVRKLGIKAIFHDNQENNQPNLNEFNSDQQDDEEETMLQALKAQLEYMKQEMKNINDSLLNKDKIIEDKDQALADKDLELQLEKDKNSDLTDKLASEKILTKELMDKNSDLTNQAENLVDKVNDLTSKLNINEEKNVILQNDLKISEDKVKPLEEKVTDLKHYSKQLEDDKIELRQDKKLLVEDKKALQEEKKLLVDENKYYFELSAEQTSKISMLEQIHCNVPEHEEWVKVIGDDQA